MKALVGAFIQEKALVGAFSIVRDCDYETSCGPSFEALVQGPGPRWGELLTIASEETIPLNETIFHWITRQKSNKCYK